MSVFKKATAFLAAVSMTATMAGCGSNTTHALEVDGYSVPAGIYIYFSNTAYNNALSQLTQENPDLDTTDVNAVKASVLEDKDVRTWIEDKATEMCVDFVATEKKFEELGLELSAEDKDYLDSMMAYYWASNQETFEKNGISEASFEKILTSSYKSDALFEYYYGIDGEEGVTEDDLYTYYTEHNIRSQYIRFDLVDGEGNMLKSDGKEQMKDMVEDYQARVEEAYDNGGVDAVMTEMNYVLEDYNYYVTSVSEEAAGVEEPATTTPRTTTTVAEDDAETDAATDDEANAEETTESETVSGDTADTEETTESEDISVDTADADTEETTEPEETEAETTTSPEEDGSTDETVTETADIADDSSEETETETVSYDNESIISVINKDDYENEEDIYYTPSEKVYNKLLEIEEADYGKPYFIEEDEYYYLVVRYDIRDRMTEDDLWSENAQYSAGRSLHYDDFEAMLDTWTSALNVTRNDAAYKRYDPFKFEF